MKNPVQSKPSRVYYWQPRKTLRGAGAGEEEAKHESFVTDQRYGQAPEERWEFNGIMIVRNF